jgi:DNA-binding NarL/FixJ family response regulator
VTVVGFVPDLMDRSRLGGIVDTFVTSAAGLAEAAAAASVVVVDLGRAGALDAIAAVAGTVPVVAFGSHVDTDLLAAARAAGATVVLPRSRLFADPEAAVRDALAGT